MRNFLLGVLFTLLAIVLGSLAYLRLGFAEVAADIPPSRWERALMFGSVHASVRRRAPEMSNPVPPTRHAGQARRTRESVPTGPAASDRRHRLHRGANLLGG